MAEPGLPLQGAVDAGGDDGHGRGVVDGAGVGPPDRDPDAGRARPRPLRPASPSSTAAPSAAAAAASPASNLSRSTTQANGRGWP